MRHRFLVSGRSCGSGATSRRKPGRSRAQARKYRHLQSVLVRL